MRIAMVSVLPDRKNPEAGLEARGPARDPLYRLLAWLSPAYPIGAFSYSHGVETAVEEGFIKDRASLVAWLESVLLRGTGAVDGALFAAAWQAATAEDWPGFDAIAERAAAWRGTMEMALESRQQGGSFLSITRTAWPHAALTATHERLGGELALPVAVALAAAAHGIALKPALAGYLHAFTANLISAALRTVPLGQTDGQLALAALERAVNAAAQAAMVVTSLDEVGTAVPLLDWCSLRHETQYTRLFRS
jgi:urease accessory protein